MENNEALAPTSGLDLGITELESMEAPFWETVGGIAVGVALGYAALAIGVT